MALSSREKNDLFWVKKRRYMVSSDYKNKSGRGYFNPDMVAEVKKAYEETDREGPFPELTGKEFDDHPPTASGQIAFAASIASMLHCLDAKEAKGAPPEETDVMIKQILEDFFIGCGEDMDGNVCSDKKKRETAQESFFKKREAYGNFIATRRADPAINEDPQKETETIFTGDRTYIDEKIRREELEKYEGVIPANYLEQLRANKFYAGVVYDTTKGDREKKVVYTTYIIDGWIELVWFAFAEEVLPEEKAPLLHYIIGTERKRFGTETRGVFFEICEEEIKSLEEFRRILSECGFQVIDTRGNVYEFSFDMIPEKQRKFLAKTAKMQNCVLLSQADENLKHALEIMMQVDSRPVPVGMYVRWEDYLEEDSLICLKEDKPCGALLLSKKDEYIIIDCAYVTDKLALSAMVGWAYCHLVEKYGKDQKVLVPIVLERTGLIVENIVCNAQRGNRIECIKFFED
ncbi:MAG: hypothetical protein K5853_00600 [Lachnospiraceae bacterium]|nr:hypothetical protein [Lachnospiraceae bacterium]